MLRPARLWSLLGYPTGPPEGAGGVCGAGTPLDTGTLHEITLDMAQGPVPGLFIRPNGPGPHGAVLYCHAHGNRYTQGAGELIHGRPSLQAPYGPALAAKGWASLSIDLAPFGARQGEGPESALAKATHWQGRTLMGDMLAELSQALDWLCARPEIDAARIATLGLSMGGTHAYWLAALDARIGAAAHLCVFSDLAPLIETGAHDLHAPYLTVPGLLAEGDMSDVAALIAPRPQLVCLGAEDPLTPGLPDSSALRRLTAAYANAPGAFECLIGMESGHVETPEMRVAVLRFLSRHLTG